MSDDTENEIERALLAMFQPFIDDKQITREIAEATAKDLAKNLRPMSKEELRQTGERVRRGTLALPEMLAILTGKKPKN